MHWVWKVIIPDWSLEGWVALGDITLERGKADQYIALCVQSGEEELSFFLKVLEQFRYMQIITKMSKAHILLTKYRNIYFAFKSLFYSNNANIP